MNASIRDPSLPRTVSACHAEIRKIREQLGEASDTDRVATLTNQITDLEGERDELNSRVASQEEKIGKLEERVEDLEEKLHPDVVDAVDKFLCEVESRPGQFRFDVVHGPAADRAILGLFDAVGRQP